MVLHVGRREGGDSDPGGGVLLTAPSEVENGLAGGLCVRRGFGGDNDAAWAAPRSGRRRHPAKAPSSVVQGAHSGGGVTRDRHNHDTATIGAAKSIGVITGHDAANRPGERQDISYHVRAARERRGADSPLMGSHP